MTPKTPNSNNLYKLNFSTHRSGKNCDKKFPLIKPNVVKSVSYKIGKRIKYYRVQKSFTQEIFGAIVGISTEIINDYEIGERVFSVEMLFKLAGALGVSVMEIVDESKFEQETGEVEAYVLDDF